MRSADLGKPDLTVIQREKSLRDLRAVAATIQTNLRAGDAQLNDLRALSVREPDAARSPELKASPTSSMTPMASSAASDRI